MTSASKKILLAVLVLVAGAAVYFSIQKPETAQADPEPMMAEEQTSVYLTSMRDMQGKTAAMDENKLIFVNVWATWCGPCNIEMPSIQKLYDRYKNNKKVAFYIISDEDAATVTPFIQKKGYQLPFYQYSGTYPAALDGNAIPRTYIIYKGAILSQEIGASNWDRPEITNLIDKQLSEI